MPAAEPQHRFRPSPGHCLFALLAVEGLLFLVDWFRWLPKGWPVLIAIATVGVLMLAMFAWFGVALVLRLRFQFSLRLLLVLTVAVAIPCSWLATSIKEARTQHDAVTVISAAEGAVWYDDRKDQVFAGTSTKWPISQGVVPISKISCCKDAVSRTLARNT